MAPEANARKGTTLCPSMHGVLDATIGKER